MTGTCECGNEPSGYINFLTSSEPINFSRRILLHGVSIPIIKHYTYINICTYICATALEVAAPTVFMVWLGA